MCNKYLSNKLLIDVCIDMQNLSIILFHDTYARKCIILTKNLIIQQLVNVCNFNVNNTVYFKQEVHYRQLFGKITVMILPF